MSNEYGIACLLNKGSSAALRNAVPFIDDKNRLHITLFQFKCDDASVLSSIRHHLMNLSVSNEFVTKAIRSSTDNIFLDIFDDGSLKLASDNIAEHYVSCAKKIEPLGQIDVSNLTLDELSLVEKYGVYWFKEKYIPHVTLAYNYKLKDNVKFIIPEIIQIGEIGIYNIDFFGCINSF